MDNARKDKLQFISAEICKVSMKILSSAVTVRSHEDDFIAGYALEAMNLKINQFRSKEQARKERHA